MKPVESIVMLSIISFLVALIPLGCDYGSNTGHFSAQKDVGAPALAGNASYNIKEDYYTVTGGGANMWGTRDDFHFLHQKISGDLLLEASLKWIQEGGDPHRKAGLMMRADLQPDAPYVDVVLHGDGLVAMQYRPQKGAETQEIRAASGDCHTLRLERHGSVFSSHLVGPDSALHPIGSFSMNLPDSVFAGLAVCSHDDKRLETAEFHHTKIQITPSILESERVTESTLEIYDLESGRRTAVYREKAHFEAPNWLNDQLVINRHGRLYKIPVSGGALQLLNTGFADQCNNDHGFSADGQWLAISHHAEGASRIYVLPATGGTPRLVTEKGPSYWHGWSPDGRTLVYCAQRSDEYDVYAISVKGGPEKRLTTAPGLDDGPEYAPDGKTIYFNSVRTGVMKIWRMQPDGSRQEQVTFNEEYADWFAHPSPDGKWLVMISYDKNVAGHPPNKNVVLRLMPVDGEPKVIAQLFGGQGTMNVPNWSPDSKKFAFVSYRQVWPD